MCGAALGDGFPQGGTSSEWPLSPALAVSKRTPKPMRELKTTSDIAFIGCDDEPKMGRLSVGVKILNVSKRLRA